MGQRKETRKRRTDERQRLGNAFGQVLRELRKKAGLSQERLGFDSGMDRVYISLLERGERSPSLLLVYDLAAALDISASELVALAEQKVAPKRR